MPRPQTDQQDEFQTRTGLPDDFDGVIRGAYFGYNPDYMRGEVPLLITPIESDELEEPHEVGWAIGKGWEIIKSGKEVRHPSHKMFVNVSMIGRLLGKCEEIGAMDFLRQNGPSPRVASTWDGLNCHWKREDVVFGKGILEEKGGKTPHLMPTEFLGEVKAAGKKTATRSAVSGLEEQVKALIPEYDTLRKFQVAAMKVPGVNDDDELAGRVMDGSIYKEAQGE